MRCHRYLDVGVRWGEEPKWTDFMSLVYLSSVGKREDTGVVVPKYDVWEWECIVLLFASVYVAQPFQMGLRKNNQSNDVFLSCTLHLGVVRAKWIKLQLWWRRKWRQEGREVRPTPLILWPLWNLERLLDRDLISNPTLPLTCDMLWANY